MIGAAQPPPTEYVCWDPSEDDAPRVIKATSPAEAAKLFTLKKQAEGFWHDNGWAAGHVIVVDYNTGETTWRSIKVTVEIKS